MIAEKLISSDSYIIGPPDQWASRLEPKLCHRGPHVVQEADGDEPG
jgi:hypothetical protein